MKYQSICMLPKLTGTGGPSSFQSKLTDGFARLGIEVNHDPDDLENSAILVIGGTRQIGALLRAKRRGVTIVQRLDGMNWLHKKHSTGLRHYLRSEGMNMLLAYIRRHLADRIVYQSAFTRDWWNTVYRSMNKPISVIHNGVDLDRFHPGGSGPPPSDRYRLLVVEGSFKGGHERDMLNAVDAARRISELANRQVELVVAGRVPDNLRAAVHSSEMVDIQLLGLVPHEQIPELNRSAHLMFPAEINAACPNAVVEALACGLPVISYATGSLPELVGDTGGRVVPYGGNYWKLEPPDTDALAKAALEVLQDLPTFRKAARKRAEEKFGLDAMVEHYRQVLFDGK